MHVVARINIIHVTMDALLIPLLFKVDHSIAPGFPQNCSLTRDRIVTSTKDLTLCILFTRLVKKIPLTEQQLKCFFLLDQLLN